MKKSIETEDLNMNQLVNNLLKQLEAKDHQMEQLNQTIANLTETINELKRKIFGISSEKSSNYLTLTDNSACSISWELMNPFTNRK